MPATAITVAHRSDGSGTTQNFTEYLVAASPTVWKLKSGSTVEWPADTQAGNGNAGVAQIISSNDGAIGYVDLSDAVGAQLQWATVKNQAGTFVEPSADSATKAGDGITVKPDLTFSAVNTTAAAGYPITAPSWVMVYANQSDAARGALVKAYVSYLIGDGRSPCRSRLRRPAGQLSTEGDGQLDQIKVGRDAHDRERITPGAPVSNEPHWDASQSTEAHDRNRHVQSRCTDRSAGPPRQQSRVRPFRPAAGLSVLAIRRSSY